jgi:hypothetical protein
LVIEGHRHSDLPIVLSECGGIALSTRPGNWGYARATTADALSEMYARLMSALGTIGLLSGFCYTQFSDTYQETNGLLDAARRPKIPLDRIAAATRGGQPAGDHPLDGVADPLPRYLSPKGPIGEAEID